MHKWVQIQMSIMHVTDIPYRWLSIPEYLHKMSKSMHMQVIVLSAKISHMQYDSLESEGFRFNNYVLLRTLLAEIVSEK